MDLSLTQTKLANFLDVTFQQVQKYEHGVNRIPVEKLYQLKHFYNVPYGIFFHGLSIDEQGVNAFETGVQGRKEIGSWIRHYNETRPAPFNF